MFELQAMVAVPEPIMLVGVIVPQISPVGIVSVRVTVPANPLRAAIVTVVVPLVPAFIVTGAVAPIVKSWILNVAFAEWTSEPLVPFTVRV